MKYVPENTRLLAREIAEGGLESASISCPAGSAFDKIRIRPVALKSGTAWQFEQYSGTKVFHRNVETENLESALALILEGGVTGAEFALSAGPTKAIRILSNRRGAVTVIRKGSSTAKTSSFPESAPTDSDTTDAAPATSPSAGNAAARSGAPKPPARSHNRAKSYILEEGIAVPFLVDLGVMTADGEVIKSKYDKFRQVNRFLEFIADVVPELEKAVSETGSDDTTRELTVVDFGCGKSYLTFATYYYLSEIRHMPVRIIGLDLKEDVIEECSGLARRYGYEKLSFAVGDIADYEGCARADMVITLHACDTATDFALAQAVRWGASVILSVPCCQHELNAQLGAPRSDTHAQADTDGKAVLAPAFRHGIIRERMAALLTDAIRAELLESAGYRVQILEFIDMSHTPKNLLIRAVLKDRSAASTRPVTSSHPAAKNQAVAGDRAVSKNRTEYERLRDFLGVNPTLERILGKESKE